MRITFAGILPVALCAAIGLGAAWLHASPTDREQLVADLGSGDLGVRNGAIADLVDADSSDFAATVRSLGDSDMTTAARSAVVDAVRSRGLPEVLVPDVTDILDAEDVSAQMAAVLCLEKHVGAARNALRRVLLDEERVPLVRMASARVLGTGGDTVRGDLSAIARRADAPAPLRGAALKALATCSTKGSKAVADLALDGKVPVGVREIAIAALGQPGTAAPGQLKVLAASKEAWVRQHACAAAFTGQHATMLPAVTGRLRDGTAEVRLAALKATIVLGGETASKVTILGMTADADPRVRCLAAQSAGRAYAAAPGAAAASLKALLLDANFAVRRQGALALYAHGDTSGVATMKADKNSPNASQAKLAVATLATINPTGN